MLRTKTESEWTCPACTLINLKDSRRCSACDHEFVKSKKFVLSIPSPLAVVDKNNNNNTNNATDPSKYSFIRSTLTNLFNGFNGNNNENERQRNNETCDDIIEIDPITSKPVRKKSHEPKMLSNNMWVCQVCSYSGNPNWNSQCEMCFSDNANPSVIASTSASEKRDARDTSPDAPGAKTSQKKSAVTRNKADDSTVYDNSLNEDIYDYARIWTCKFCTFINFNKDIQCELCLTPRLNNLKSDKSNINKTHKSQEIITVPPDQWVCQRCTFFNTQSEKKCALCKEPKTSKEVDSRTKNSKWCCEICSYKNEASTKICVVCFFDSSNKADEDEDNEPSLPNADSLNITDPENQANSFYFDGNQNTSSTLSRSNTLNSSIIAQRSKSAYRNYANATTHAERIWKNIVRYCKNHQITFVDDSFPPCDKSLYVNLLNKPAEPGRLKHGSIHWLRPNHIRSSSSEKNLKWTVYNNPKFSDIKQGLLGDCWLISAIAVLIEQPEMLRKIIITQDYCQEGCYQVRLCHNGEWQTVIVDDLFPCDQNAQLIYSQASRKQLWIPLIEKAMAKLNGSYESLIAGQTVEGLSVLTGFPCDAIRLEKMNLCRSEEEEIDFDIIWVKLLSMKEAGYTMGASCGRLDNTDEKYFTDRGLLSRHAYSILNITEINGHQLIQLRNPWGRYTWNGDWSEHSSKWTPELRRALGLKKQNMAHREQQQHAESAAYNLHYGSQSRSGDEGVFWMSFDDFRKYFGIIDVCKTRLDLYESRMSGYFNPEGTREMQAYHMVVFEASQIDIGLFHKTNKNRRENSDLDLGFVVLKSTGNKDCVGELVIASNRAVRKFIGSEHMFTPGEYLIIPISLNFWYTKESIKNSNENTNNANDKEAALTAENNSNKPYNNLYNLVIHSTKEFFIEQEMHHAFLLADTMIQLCLKLGQPKKQDIKDATVYALSKNWCGLIVVVENASPNAYLHIEVECLKSMNVVSTRQTLCTTDSIPPCHRQVLIALTHLEGSNGYSINYNISYRASSNALLNTWPRLEGQRITNHPAITKKTFGLHAPRSMFLFN